MSSSNSLQPVPLKRQPAVAGSAAVTRPTGPQVEKTPAPAPAKAVSQAVPAPPPGPVPVKEKKARKPKVAEPAPSAPSSAPSQGQASQSAPAPASAPEKKKRAPTSYNQFVAERMKTDDIKKIPARQRMSAIGQEWKAKKPKAEVKA